VNLKVEDYYPSGKRFLLRFKEKAAKRKSYPSTTSWKSSSTSILNQPGREGAGIFFVPGFYRKDRQVVAPAACPYRRRGHAQTTTQAGRIASSLFAPLISGDRHPNFLENDGTLEAAQRIAGHARHARQTVRTVGVDATQHAQLGRASGSLSDG
jgi:hypothetical protein